jgi:pimeloyl-ACP methyl ester carboxylesterase
VALRFRTSGTVRYDLTKVDVPTLVIHGGSDAIVPFEVSGRRSHEAIPGSSLELIEGGPHAINTAHAERFNRALVDFLRL